MVSYSANGTNTVSTLYSQSFLLLLADQYIQWHMFYIGKNNTLLERINSNKTNLWRDGPLGQLGLLALDDRNVGLQACWYGDYYGASTRGNNTNAQQIGLHLWYGSASKKIDELTFVYGSDQWVTGAPILGYNGHAGIGCYSWGGGSVTYLMLVNQQSQVEILWKELNTTLTSTTTHPVNTWTKGKFCPVLSCAGLKTDSKLSQQREQHSLPCTPTPHWATQSGSLCKTPTTLSPATTSAGQQKIPPSSTKMAVAKILLSSVKIRGNRPRDCRERI